MKNPERYPQVKDIKTLEDILEDVDKKLVIQIFDETKMPDVNRIALSNAHKIGRVLQYIKVLANELIEIKKKL